jgi:hypothetical protein
MATVGIALTAFLGKGIRYLKTLSSESLNDIDSLILAVLIGTACGVVLGKDCGTTAGDFGISECEHGIISFG